MKTSISRLLAMAIIGLLTISCGFLSFGDKDEESSGGVSDLLPSFGSKMDLGEEYLSEEGGYAFQVIPEYQIEEFYGLVTMLAPDADPEIGPGITFIGGIYDESKSAEQLLTDFEGGLEAGSEIGKTETVKVFGIQGLSAEVQTNRNGKDAYGRIVVVSVSPTQKFTMLGVYPNKNWEKEYGDTFEAVLESVHFFVPVDGGETASQPQVSQTGGLAVRQWANNAKASSEYGNPSWAASQATGPPDTPECGDHETAWASSENYSVEWLEVGFDKPVIPSEINIYETHTPSQIVKVELLDTSGKYHEIYTSTPKLTDCPFILSIPIANAAYQVQGAKITVDQSKLNLPWDEIDAVELVGVSAGGGAAVAPEPPAAPPSSGGSLPFVAIPTSNPDQGASYSLSYAGTYEDTEQGDNIEVSVHADRIDIRFKGEHGRYLLITLPPGLPDNFSVNQLSPFLLEGRTPTSAGYYLRSVWYFGTQNGNVSTYYNPDGTLSGQAQFEAITAHNAILYISLSFDHVSLD